MSRERPWQRKPSAAAPPPIRIVNTRTGKRITAAGGKDAARILKIESDRRTGIELAEQTRILEKSAAGKAP